MNRFMVLAFLNLIAGILLGRYFPAVVGGIALLALVLAANYICFKKYKSKVIFILPLLALFGFVSVINVCQPKDSYIDSLAEAGETVEVVGTVNNIAYNSNDTETVFVKIKSINNQEYTKNVVINAYTNETGYIVGQDLKITGVFKFLETGEPGEFNEWQYYKSRGVDYSFKIEEIVRGIEIKTSFNHYIWVLRQKVNNILEYAFTDDTVGIAKALTTGDKSDITDDIEELYSSAGISHILAISGLHVGLLAGLIMWILGSFKLKRTHFVYITIGILTFFAVFTGLKPSTVRAVLMTSLVLFGVIVGKDSDVLNNIALAAVIILFANPLNLWDAGFQLSFSTVAGLAIGNKLVHDDVMLPKPLKVSIIAWLASLPFTMYYFYQITIVGIIVNIIVIPLMAIVTAGCFAVALIGLVLPKISVFLAGGVYIILKFYEFVCVFFTSLPLAVLKTGFTGIFGVVALYLNFSAIRFFRKNKKHYIYLCGTIVITLAVFILPRFGSTLEVAVLDVGQGDSTVITTADKTAIVIDTGGNFAEEGKNTGAKKVYPYLKYKGISSIDMLFLSHIDNDHAFGTLELMDLTDIGAIYMNDYENRDKGLYDKIVKKAELKNIEIRYIDAGDYIEVDDEFVINCVYPFGKYGVYDENSGSLVLKMDYKDVSFLFTGDIGIDQEKTLVASVEDLDVDVLKVAHHGSAESTGTEFLKATTPDIGVISCGENNTYGHPSPETLKRLTDANVEVYNTATDGRIVIKTDGTKLEVAE